MENLLYSTVLANLTRDDENMRRASKALYERMHGKVVDIDLTVCLKVFESVFDAAEQLHTSHGDGWPEVFLQYLALFDEKNYSPMTGLRMLQARKVVYRRLSEHFVWDEYDRNWKRVMATAAQLLLEAPHDRPKLLEENLKQAALNHHRTSDLRKVIETAAEPTAIETMH